MADALRQGARILDIGRTVDFFDRHEHVADLVLATDLAGFSHRQVALLAAVVRQAGDEDERLGRSLAPLVTDEDEEPLERAAVLLALADEITERTPPGSAAALACRTEGGPGAVVVPALPRGACAASASASRRPSGGGSGSSPARRAALAADAAGVDGPRRARRGVRGRSVRSKWARSARSRAIRSSFGRKPWSWRGCSCSA